MDTTTPDTSVVETTVAPLDTTPPEEVTEPTTTSLQIGSNGGTLTSDDGVVTLVVPPDAVLSTTTFSITTAPSALAGTRRGAAYRLQPDVVDFARPVLVSVSDDSVDSGTSLLVLDEVRDVWLPVGRSRVAEHTVSAPRWRFGTLSWGATEEALASLDLTIVDHTEAMQVVGGRNDHFATGYDGKEFATLEAACARARADVPFFELGAGATPIRLHRYHQVMRITLGAGTFAGAVCDLGIGAPGRGDTTINGPLTLVDARGPSGGFTVHSTRDGVTLVGSALADVEVSGCRVGVTLAGTASTLFGSTVRDNATGVLVQGSGAVLTSNVLTCNTTHDLDARVATDARDQRWDHAPPSAQDVDGSADTTGALLADEPCE